MLWSFALVIYFEKKTVLKSAQSAIQMYFSMINELFKFHLEFSFFFCIYRRKQNKWLLCEMNAFVSTPVSKWKPKHTTLSEQFQSLIERNQRKRGKIDTHNTHRHGRSLSWVCTETSIKRGGVKLVLCEQTSTLILIIMKILSRISIHFIYRYIMKTRILESA